MSGTSKGREATVACLAPRVKVWLECGGEYVFGLGLCEVLQAIDRSGSIKQAACDVGLSYRHVWGRIKEAERAGGCPLVETRIGGRDKRRSCLTNEARRLVAAFLAFRERVTQLVQREFARHFPSSQESSPAAPSAGV